MGLGAGLVGAGVGRLGGEAGKAIISKFAQDAS